MSAPGRNPAGTVPAGASGTSGVSGADAAALTAAARGVLARLDRLVDRAGRPGAVRADEPGAVPADRPADEAGRGGAGDGAARGGTAADDGGADDGGAGGGGAGGAGDGSAGDGSPGEPAALAALVACFGLSPFEREIVLLTAAAELDPSTGRRCAAAAGDPAAAHPTFTLALAALTAPHWSALTPVAPLRRWRLVEPVDETRLTTTRLRLDERILHFLLGSPYLDARLHGLLRRTAPPARLPDAYRRAAERVAAAWAAPRGPAPLRAELLGGDAPSRAEIAAAAAEHSGLGMYTVAAHDIPADAAERDRLARLWQREAVLLPAALLVETDGAEREQAAAADAFVAVAGVPLAVSGGEPAPAGRARGERVAVPELSEEEQFAVWRRSFADDPRLTDAHLRTFVAQFQLPPHLIRSAAESVRHRLSAPAPDGAADATESAPELLWQAGLAETRIGLDELGRRIEPRAGWDDLVLAQRHSRVLREIVAHVRRRAVVHQEWGFAGTLRRGLGVTALFAGGSGTGKTLAAEVMARELGLDLFVIDLSQVVSKYIGETEKNLRRVFDAAERGGALLLFDEADALFGRRSEVKDSHDRYANLEVSYLLMRMEAYRGLAVLTTNMKKALDPAFTRRIRFVVDFPFPGAAERAEIWRRVLPAQAPTEDLDPELLARLTVAGGSIRNIALSGAFLAAEEGDRLRMRHMLAAARTEYQKLERSLTPSEVRGWI